MNDEPLVSASSSVIMRRRSSVGEPLAEPIAIQCTLLCGEFKPQLWYSLQVLYRQAPAIAYMLSQELGLASACWHKCDTGTSGSTIFTLRLQ